MDNQEKLFSEFPPVTRQEWENVIQADLKGADYEKKLVWSTNEGFKIQPYYRAEDLENIEYLRAIPGEFPFVRGNKTNNNCWEIRQDIIQTNPAEANHFALDAIGRGADAVGFDVHEIKSVSDLEVLLNGIDLLKVSIHFYSSASYPQILDLFVHYLDSKSIAAENVRGSFNFDPLGYALLKGSFYTTEENNMVEAEYLLKSVEAKLPKFRFLTVNGKHIHNAGATLVQELGYTLAAAHEYLFNLINKGHKVDEITPRMMFSLATGSNYFMEIAKIRAARMLWARIVEQYTPTSEESLKIFIHTTTSLWNKTVYDPYVNMLRTTTEAMSSAIGGADSIAVLPFDVTYKTPDDFSYRIARNQQILLKEESYMDKVVDPAAGSYYIETLTDSIAKHAWDLFRSVEEKGGFTACLLSNMIQDDIEKTAMQRNMDIATRKIVVLGTNQYPNLGEAMIEKVELESVNTDKPSTFRKLSIYRGSEAIEEVRMATEKYVKEGNKRPQVFMFTYGNLAMRKARAGFATNFFGCAGYEIIDNLGFKTVEDGVQAFLNSKAEMVVICSSDEEYAEITPAICKALKDAGSKASITLAGYPKELIDSFKEAGVQEFIHVRSNVLETLKNYQKHLGIN